MAKRHISASDVGAAPAALEDRVADLESGERRKILILADPPDPARVNEYVELATGMHRYWNGTSWAPVVTRVDAPDLVLEEGSLDGGDPLSDYPLGVSVIGALGPDLGWPSNDNYNVPTVRTTTSRGSQIVFIGSGTRVFTRRFNASIPGWGAWAEL